MKKLFLSLSILSVVGLAGYIIAADHIDAPGVASTSSDITDYYAFASPSNSDNLVFVANVQGLLSPSATSGASFDENVMVEFNIDNTGDNVEDMVIQCVFADGKMHLHGPVVPSSTGITSIVEGNAALSVDITSYGSSAAIGNANGISAFAGPRDDPFFFDFAQFGEILAGNATGFNDPGSDTFAGTNVMSVVVEVPKSMLGSAASLNTWVESKSK